MSFPLPRDCFRLIPPGEFRARQIALWPESRTPLRQRELRVGYVAPHSPKALHSSASSLIAHHWSSAGPALPWVDVPRPFGIDRVAPRAKGRNVSRRKKDSDGFFFPAENAHEIHYAFNIKCNRLHFQVLSRFCLVGLGVIV